MKFVPIKIETSPKDNKVVLMEQIKYKDVIVEAGYKSDGLTKLLNKYRPNCLRAAIVHDKVCDGCFSIYTGLKIPRKVGDQYFLEVLELDGVSKFNRYKMYWAVSAYRIATFKK